MKIDAVLAPDEFAALAQRDLRSTACVVFDVLRATSTIVTALHHGAKSIIPVSEIAEAIALHQSRPGILLGGERNGLRISAEGIDFDLGNSPREYTPEKVRGQTIVATTTNGTRALRACAHAQTTLAAAFLNLTATAQFIRQQKFTNVLLVCAGTGENTALEDVLAAGALCDRLTQPATPLRPEVIFNLSDSAQIAWRVWLAAKADLAGVLGGSENARRLLAMPELRDDVAFCARLDSHPLVAIMSADGNISTVQPV